MTKRRYIPLAISLLIISTFARAEQTIDITAEGKVGIGTSTKEETKVCSWIDESNTKARLECMRLAIDSLLRIIQGKEAFLKPEPKPNLTDLINNDCWSFEKSEWEPCISVVDIYTELIQEEPSNLTVVWKVASNSYELGFRSDGVVVWRKEERE